MASKKIISISQSTGLVLIVLGFVAVFNYLSTRKFIRLDLTESGMYSISNASKNILRNLDDIVNIKVYFSKNLPPHVAKIESDVRDLLSEYKAYAGNKLRISWEDPGENEETKRKVRALGIPELQMQSFEKDKAQVINGFLGIAVLYADRKEVLPVIQELTNFEYDLTLAIMKVLRSETPQLAVLKTDTTPFIPQNVRMQMRMQTGDPTEEKYKPVFENLKNNYDVELVDISEGRKIDSKFKTLIVPGGENFSNRALYEIDQFFMNGGNLIVLADAVTVSFQYGVTGRAQHTKLLDLLEHYGARVEQQMVLDASCGQVQIPQNFGAFQMNVAIPYPYFVRIGSDGFNRDNPAVANLGEVIMPWASPITILAGSEPGDTTVPSRNITATVLAHSSPKSWIASGSFNLEPRQQWAPPEASLKTSTLMASLSGDFTSYFSGKPVPPVKEESDDALSQIKLAPEDEARQTKESVQDAYLVIAGDSDFLSQQNAAPGNIAWLLNVVDWLTLDKNLISIRTRTLVDRTIRKDQLETGSMKPMVIRTVNIILMPLLLIIVGLVIFFKRRQGEAASIIITEEKNEQ